jgi:hypothetical protein
MLSLLIGSKPKGSNFDATRSLPVVLVVVQSVLVSKPTIYDRIINGTAIEKVRTGFKFCDIRRMLVRSVEKFQATLD